MDRVNEIRQQIEAAVKEALPQLNNASKTAEYKQWMNVFANVQAAAEKIIELDQEEIAAIVDNNHVGTALWYVQLAKQFQWAEGSDGLNKYKPVVDTETGAVKYNIIDTAARIITQAACVVKKNEVLVKVATGEPGGLVKISDKQKAGLKSYLDDLKIAGVKLRVINDNADLIALRATIHRNPAYDEESLEKLIIEALDKYSTSLPYNGAILRNAIIDAIQAVPGVVDVEMNDVIDNENSENNVYCLCYTSDVEPEPVRIERAYVTSSGYFNFKKDDVFPALTFVESNDNSEDDD